MAQLLDLFPSPEEIAAVADTPFARMYPRWGKHGIPPNDPHDKIKLITALVRIQLSPKGREWGVSLSDIPESTLEVFRKTCCTSIWGSDMGRVAAGIAADFFRKSLLTENDPRQPSSLAPWQFLKQCESSHPEAGILCGQMERMLFAVQQTPAPEPQGPSKILCDVSELEERLGNLGDVQMSALEDRLKKLGDVQVLALEERLKKLGDELALEERLKRLEVLITKEQEKAEALEKRVRELESRHIQADQPTCLMSLFKDQPGIVIPYTEKMAELPVEATTWLASQLMIRPVWIRAGSIDSKTNYISWDQFEGAMALNLNAFGFAYHRFTLHCSRVNRPSPGSRSNGF